jgi:outer membrane translocation and assembly module TamA
MSEEDLAKTRKQIEDLEKQLASLPEGQRAMLEGMIKPQLELLNKMVEEGEVDMTLTTKEVRVTR